MDDLDKLEQLARAASPGPWKWREICGSVSLDRGGTVSDHVLFAAPCGYENSSVIVEDADASYIAAVSPDVVFRLIERLRDQDAGRCRASLYPGHDSWTGQDCGTDGVRCALAEGHRGPHVTPDGISEPTP